MAEQIDYETWKEVEKELRYKRTPLEIVLARLEQLDEQIDQLTRVKAKYEQELDNLTKEENGERVH